MLLEAILVLLPNIVLKEFLLHVQKVKFAMMKECIDQSFAQQDFSRI
jgi:hypothetical protein